MRRAFAVLLVLAFSLPLIAPALASSFAEASLPACCRRNGKHHCMMPGMMTVSVPSKYHAVSEKCPYSPSAGTALMLPHALAMDHNPASGAAQAGPAELVREAEAGYRISFHRARQKRGPPQLPAL